MQVKTGLFSITILITMAKLLSLSLSVFLVFSFLPWGDASARPAYSAASAPASGAPVPVSSTPSGVPVNGSSYNPSISADGRYLAFVSQASNLVDGDTNNSADVFLFDRANGDTRRISISSSGEQGNGWSYQPAISGDGRYIAFTSRSSNLAAPGSQPQQANIYLHDRIKKETWQVSTAPAGKPANGWSEWPAISADGRFVAFSSLANNLVPGDENSVSDIFLYDRLNAQVIRVSQSSGSNGGGRWSIHPALSGDGRYLAYAAIETNQPGEGANIYVYDRLTGQSLCLSCSESGFNGLAARNAPAISADGGLVAFAGWLADSLPRQDPVAVLYLFDRKTSRSTLLPGSRAAKPGDIQYALSEDGSSLLFSTSTSANNDLQAYDLAMQKTVLCSRAFVWIPQPYLKASSTFLQTENSLSSHHLERQHLDQPAQRIKIPP